MRSAIASVACLAGLTLAVSVQAAEPKTPKKSGEELRVVPDIQKRIAQFVPTPFSADLSALTADDRKVLGKLVEAGKLMNEIFLRQAWTGNPAMRTELKALNGPHAAAAREYFDINYGPWDRLAERQPFVGTQTRPAGAGYYPEDLTKQDFEAWIAKHPGRQGEAHLHLHGDPPRQGRRPRDRALLPGVRRVAEARGEAAAGGGGAHRQRLAQEVPGAAGRRLR